VIWEDHFYPEIVDPHGDAVLPEGARGELVFTSLTKEALPIIRYRTRDLSALLRPTARPMRRMARISARSDDMLIVRGVNVFPSQIEELVLAVAGLTPHYQLELTRSGALDELTVLAESGAGVDADEALRARLEGELRARIKALIGVSVRVRVVPPGQIERSSGKARRVIDKRAAR
jgi:phenylacetate-CoA ligase